MFVLDGSAVKCAPRDRESDKNRANLISTRAPDPKGGKGKKCKCCQEKKKFPFRPSCMYVHIASKIFDIHEIETPKKGGTRMQIISAFPSR
jgi:hypothetical protein